MAGLKTAFESKRTFSELTQRNGLFLYAALQTQRKRHFCSLANPSPPPPKKNSGTRDALKAIRWDLVCFRASCSQIVAE